MEHLMYDCKTARGINREDSLVHRSSNNYIRRHSGLNGRTPAEHTGIIIQGRDKWLTLTQNAAIAA